MRLKLVKLKGMRILRPGGIKENPRYVDRTLHSDTIFSAIASKAFKLFGENEVDNFLKNLRVSSLIYTLGEDILIFAPKYIPQNLKDDSNFKMMKKAKYVYLKDITKWFKGEKVRLDLDPSDIHEIPRVALDRLDNSSNLFYSSVLMVKKNYIPAFLADYPEEFEEIFSSSLRLLGDEGIGGDRTIGFGLFDLAFEEIDLPSEGDHWVILSLYRPTIEELRRIPRNSYYRIVRKGGWLSDLNLQKPRCAFFEEGSVFKFKPVGDLKFLEHHGKPFYIYGKPISIGVKLC